MHHELSLRSRKCLWNFEFKWVQERFLIGQVLGSKEMYRKFCPKMYQEMFLKTWYFLLPKSFRKFHILGIFPGLGNFIFLSVKRSSSTSLFQSCFPVVLRLFGGYLLNQALIIWLLSSRVWCVVCKLVCKRVQWMSNVLGPALTLVNIKPKCH